MKSVAIALLVASIGTFAFAQTSMDHQQMGSHQDRMFADAMSRHHQDGIRMAEMAVERTASAELRTMAQKMIDDQRREIADLQRHRGTGPQTTPAEMMSMPGMMPESEMRSDMARLEANSGVAFDRVFTEVMAKHHQGAIVMSQHQVQHGQNVELKELARMIADKQSRERTQLLAMNEQLDGAGEPAMTSASGERTRMTKD